MSIMEQQAQDQIEAGVNEREQLIRTIEAQEAAIAEARRGMIEAEFILRHGQTHAASGRQVIKHTLSKIDELLKTEKE